MQCADEIGRRVRGTSQFRAEQVRLAQDATRQNRTLEVGVDQVSFRRDSRPLRSA